MSVKSNLKDNLRKQIKGEFHGLLLKDCVVLNVKLVLLAL